MLGSVLPFIELIGDEQHSPVTISYWEGTHRPAQHPPVLSGDLDAIGKTALKAATMQVAAHRSAGGHC